MPPTQLPILTILSSFCAPMLPGMIQTPWISHPMLFFADYLGALEAYLFLFPPRMGEDL